MPNWCYTQIIFQGEKEELKEFRSKIKEWTRKNYVENGFGVNWLGNILHGAGLGHRIDSGDDRIRCRGEISYIGYVGPDEDSTMGTFDIETETAWAPMCLMWTEVIKAMGYKSIGFSYHAEEPGCELYEIYDPYGYFDEKYYIDIYLDGEDEKNDKLMRLYDDKYLHTDEVLRYELQRLLDTDEENLKTLIDKAENYEFKSEDSYLYVHEYNYVDSIEE